jgi:putative ABC transport system permease protein
MSLGASGGQVQRLILREGGMLLALGLGVGVIGALITGRVMRGLLFGIAPHDPATFVAASLVMVLLGVVACWIPALRAARVSPVVTMRSMQ